VKNRDWIRTHDQDVMNIAFKNNVLFLPLRWNASSVFFRKSPKGLHRTRTEIQDAVRGPGIVHYTGPDKPWVIPGGAAAHSFSHEYFRYLAMTPFASQAEVIRKNFGLRRRAHLLVWYWWKHPGFFLRPSYWRNRHWQRWSQKSSM